MGYVTDEIAGETGRLTQQRAESISAGGLREVRGVALRSMRRAGQTVTSRAIIVDDA